MLIRILDLETTGVPTETVKHAVCEVGWCDVVVQGHDVTVGDPEAMLCNPGRPMPPDAQAVHHIADYMVATAPPPTEAFKLLMAGKPDAWCAHHARFEQQFFAGGEAPWICTRKVGLRLWPDSPSHSNQCLRYFLKIDLEPAFAAPTHRAGPDAYVTANILAAALKLATVDQMIAWSQEPDLLPRITIGDHRGKPWADVPGDFLSWMLSKPDMDADLKWNARRELDLRDARSKLLTQRINPLWEDAPSCGAYGDVDPRDGKAMAMIRNGARTRVFAFVSEKIGVEVTHATIGILSLEQCRQAWTALFNVTYPQIREWSKQRETEAA